MRGEISAMDNRKQQVLTAIVRLYSSDGEPVGSTVLAKHLHMTVSSATLRSEMAALTKLGLLTQPHTSAGRIPSPQGYRYYIDNLLEDKVSLPLIEKLAIDEIFTEMDLNPEHLPSHAARTLSQISGFASLVLTPESTDACAAHFEVIQVGLYTVAVLCVSNVGGVSTRTAKLQKPLQKGDLQILSDTLNKYLTFTSYADLTAPLLQSALQNLGERRTALLPCIDAAQKLLAQVIKSKLHSVGHHNLLKYEDYSSNYAGISLRNLMAFMSDEKAARDYLPSHSPRTSIMLGEDISAYPMPGFFVISKQYVAGGGRTGSIAVIGPSRMNFKDIIPKLEYFAELLSEYMSGYTKGGL